MQEWVMVLSNEADLHQMTIESRMYLTATPSSAALSAFTLPHSSNSPFSEDPEEGIVHTKKEEPAEDQESLPLPSFNRNRTGASKASDSPPQINEPRKRGRPRKYPLQAEVALSKPTKGRSKTGCLTCRRRKKKCDETKPMCMNCQKNAVVCEGYQAKEIWKSGRQREEDELFKQATSYPVPRTLPSLVDGVETATDRRFLDHFAFTLSRLLTLVNDDTNPYKAIILPMALHNQGLMHALLSLSGSHLFGVVRDLELSKRSDYHFWQCVSCLRKDIAAQKSLEDEIEPTIIASTLVLCLKCICEGQTHGEYRHHMDAARRLLATRQPRDREFGRFALEFFQYNDISNSLTSLDRRPLALVESIHTRKPDEKPMPGFYIGMMDGLYSHVTATTTLRDQVRQRLREGQKPAINYDMLARAMEIDVAIREWSPPYAPGTEYWYAGQVYRQVLWVYLYRTIYISDKWEKVIEAVDDGLEYFEKLPPDSAAYSVLSSPLFLLGCSSFTESQRVRLRRAFSGLKAYSHKRNLDVGLLVMERIWQIMDINIAEAWDWQQIIASMGIDFLAT